MTVDPYIDRATGVLRNRLGLANRDTLAGAEADIFAGLAKEDRLRGLPRDAFVDRVTHYLAEVNALHPFREGNGRAQRAFFHQLCREAGWPLTWVGLDQRRNDIASRAALRGDNTPFREMLDHLIVSD